MTVTLRNCQTGKQLGPPFQSLLTFNVGGTLNESTANPNFYPDVRLPGQGYWKGFWAGDLYQASSTALITLNGALTETQRIDQMILLSGNNLASDAEVHFYDPSGKLLRSGCATAVGGALPVADSGSDTDTEKAGDLYPTQLSSCQQARSERAWGRSVSYGRTGISHPRSGRVTG